jgi:hypothetical protein
MNEHTEEIIGTLYKNFNAHNSKVYAICYLITTRLDRPAIGPNEGTRDTAAAETSRWQLSLI